MSMGHPEARPGHYGEDPDAARPKVKLWEWTPFKIYFLVIPAIALVIHWVTR